MRAPTQGKAAEPSEPQGREVERSAPVSALLLPDTAMSIALIGPGNLIVGVLGFQLLCRHGVFCTTKALEEEEEKESDHEGGAGSYAKHILGEPAGPSPEPLEDLVG